jgi:hypothetical protein
MFADSGILISFPSGFDQVSIKKKARGDKPAASVTPSTHG